MLKSRDELRAFVASLRIPESRRSLVESEIFDHLESRIEAELAAGEDLAVAEEAAFAALGDQGALRASLERVEPAFGLVPLRAAASGALSSAAASVLFGISGALFPRQPGAIADLSFWSVVGLMGLAILRSLAPRGIGSALKAELRASIGPREPSSPRRRAVLAYVSSVIFVPCAFVPAALFLDLRAVEDVLGPVSVLGFGFGCYALHLMRRARRERALMQADHGA